MDICRHCGKRKHKSLICPVDKESTAVRKDVLRAHAPGNDAPEAGEAGTQAPPVDTNQVEGHNPDAGKPVRSRPDTRSREESDGSFLPPPPLVTTSPGTVGDKDRGPFDRRTYARDYMKGWRKRKTEERSTDRAFVEVAKLTLDPETFDKILRLAMEKN